MQIATLRMIDSDSIRLEDDYRLGGRVRYACPRLCATQAKWVWAERRSVAPRGAVTAVEVRVAAYWRRMQSRHADPQPDGSEIV